MYTASFRVLLNTSTIAAICTLSAGSLAADSYYLRHNQFSPHNWESIGSKFGWHAEREGPEAVVDFFVQNGDYFNNGFVLRTINGEPDKFDGRTLTLSGGSLELRHADAEKNNQVGELIIAAQGSTIENGVHTGPAGLHVTHLVVNGPLSLGKTGKDYRTLRLRIDKLTGKGDLQTVSVGGLVKLSITDATAYTGSIVHQVGKLDFDAPLTSRGELKVIAGATVILDEPVTFAAVTLNGVSLQPGIHSYEELTQSFPGVFAPDGIGSITIKK